MGHAPCMFGPVAGQYCSRQVLHIVSSSFTYTFNFCTGCRAPLLAPCFFHSIEPVHSMLWKHYQGTLSLSCEHNCFNNAFGQSHQGLMCDFKHESVHVFPNGYRSITNVLNWEMLPNFSHTPLWIVLEQANVPCVDFICRHALLLWKPWVLQLDLLWTTVALILNNTISFQSSEIIPNEFWKFKNGQGSSKVSKYFKNTVLWLTRGKQSHAHIGHVCLLWQCLQLLV